MKPLLEPTPIGGSALVRDYLAGVPGALAFYGGGAPYDLASFRAKLLEVQQRFGPEERARAASALHPTTERARERLARFVREGGAMVTTGQQAGFLTGPLYTIQKALSAVALARELETRLGVLVLPVFWIASEDHDWAEANHAVLVDRAGSLRRFTLASEDPRPLPMSERPLVGDLESLCDEVLQAVRLQGDGIEWARRILEPYRRAGRSVADGFREAIGSLFEGIDLLITDAAHPVVKMASRSVLEGAIEGSREQEARLLSRTAELRGAGYSPQVRVLEGGTNLFLRTEAGRQRVERRDSTFVARGIGRALSGSTLRELARTGPERLSPNVFLRPVVESAVFPTLAYVGGPGEVAYFAQLGVLFEEFGIRPPVVMPRYAGSVVEPGVERRLASLSLRRSDLERGRIALREELALRAMPIEARGALESLREALSGGYRELIEAAGPIDATLRGALGSARNRSLREVQRAERSVIRALKRRDERMLARLDRVLAVLRPEGQPQDRVLNVLTFLGVYGGELLQEIRRSIELHWRLPMEG